MRNEEVADSHLSVVACLQIGLQHGSARASVPKLHCHHRFTLGKCAKCAACHAYRCHKRDSLLGVDVDPLTPQDRPDPDMPQGEFCKFLAQRCDSIVGFTYRCSPLTYDESWGPAKTLMQRLSASVDNHFIVTFGKHYGLPSESPAVLHARTYLGAGAHLPCFRWYGMATRAPPLPARPVHAAEGRACRSQICKEPALQCRRGPVVCRWQ